ncbi:MAG: hypothetical protein HUJ80_03735 [Firmicutes bacterium]|nr:hypothetical protein [Bacillota bacterium]
MKTFLVFLALVLLFTGFLVYTADLSFYLRLQSELKTAAEECADAAALMSDSRLLGEGLLVIDPAGALQVVSVLAKDARERFPAGGSISFDLQLFDDEKGYEGCRALGIEEGRPAAYVCLTYTGDDLFRLPSIRCCQIVRSAVYQWEYGLTSH